MARISSYEIATPKVEDLLIISQQDNTGDAGAAEGPYTTKNTSISSLVTLLNAGIVPGTGTVSSVGVSAPSAFTVTNSPVTTSGTIAITGAGTTSQYIDGTGSLQTLPSNTITGVAANTALSITGTTLSTEYNTQIGPTVQSVAVGGAPAAPASEWKAKNIVEVLDTILFPTISATISIPASSSLAVSPRSNTIEIGTTIARTLTATFVQGQITDGNGTPNANPLVGAATGSAAYTFTGTGISSTAQAGATLSVSTAIVAGSNQWSVSVAHGAGSGNYFDNKGNVGTNLDDPFRLAGTKTGSTAVITGKYKQFYGASATAVTDSAGVRALSNNRFDSTGTFTTPTFNQVKFVIAIPNTRTLTNVITSNNETITSNFVQSTVSVTDGGTGSVSYDVYTFTSVVALGVTATVTIS